MRSSDRPATWPAEMPVVFSRSMWALRYAWASSKSKTGGAGRPVLRRGAARALLARGVGARHQRGVDPVEHDGPVDHALADVAAARQLVHEVEQHLFEDGPQAAGAGAPEQRLVRDRLEGVVGELELDVLELEDLAVLLDEGVLRLVEDADQGLVVEARHRADDRQATHELGDEAELEQVLRLHLLEELGQLVVVVAGDVGGEAHPVAPDAALDDLLEPGEGPTADEQDVRGVDLDELLVGVLAAPLRRHRGGGALQDL